MDDLKLLFLEPSRPLQACNGTALPLPLPLRCDFAPHSVHKTWTCTNLRLLSIYSLTSLLTSNQ
jgi:hypothetical protein